MAKNNPNAAPSSTSSANSTTIDVCTRSRRTPRQSRQYRRLRVRFAPGAGIQQVIDLSLERCATLPQALALDRRCELDPKIAKAPAKCQARFDRRGFALVGARPATVLLGLRDRLLDHRLRTQCSERRDPSVDILQLLLSRRITIRNGLPACRDARHATSSRSQARSRTKI